MAQDFVTKIQLTDEDSFQESGGSLQLYGKTHLASFSANTVSVIDTPITGTTANVVLVWDATDKQVKIVTQTSIAGQTAAAGNDTEVQFNKTGTTTGDQTFTFDHTNEALTLGSRLGAIGTHSFTQGCDNEASGYYSSGSGYKSTASGMFSHAEGSCSLADSLYSHAEGFATSATSSGSHSEGGRTLASGAYSHAEGCLTDAGGVNSHAEGYKTTAHGFYTHAQGCYTSSCGIGSHTGGRGTATRNVFACNKSTFNHSYNDSSQTLGHGALAPYSAILGGKNHNIGVSNTGATIIGGDSIKLTGTTYVDTTAVANLAIMTQPTSGSSLQVLTRNTTTGEIEYTTVTASATDFWKTSGTTIVTNPIISGDTTFKTILNNPTGDETALLLSYDVDKATSGDGIGLHISATTTTGPGGSEMPLRVSYAGSDIFKIFTTGVIHSPVTTASLWINSVQGYSYSGKLNFNQNDVSLTSNVNDILKLQTNNGVDAVIIDTGQTVNILTGLTLTTLPTSGTSDQILIRNTGDGSVEYRDVESLTTELDDNYWKVSGTTNVTNPTISGSTTFDGGITLATGSGNGLYFGDGDTGFYELADDLISVQLLGGTKFYIATSYIGGADTNAFSLQNEASTATNPTVIPNKADTATGLGGAAGEVSLITGGIEAVNIDTSQFVTMPVGLGINGASPTAAIPLNVNLVAGADCAQFGGLRLQQTGSACHTIFQSANVGKLTLRGSLNTNDSRIYLYGPTAGGAQGRVQIIGGTAISDVAVSSVYITGPQPWASATTNLNAGHVFIDGGAAISTGTTGNVKLATFRGFVEIGLPTSGSTSDVVLVRNPSTSIIESKDSSALLNKYAVTGVTGNTTLTSNEYVVLVDSSGGALTITLPSSPTTNQAYKIKDKGNALTNNITIDGNGANIDGSSTALINTDYGALELLFDGTEWFSLAFIN